MSADEVRVASLVLNAILAPLLALVWKESRSTKRQIDLTHDLIKTQNGRVLKLEQWTRDHEILDQERSVNIVSRLDRVQTTMDAIKVTYRT